MVQHSLLTLVSSIYVTSVHSNHLISHWQYDFSQLANWCMAKIGGSMIDHQFLLLSKDEYSLLTVHIISQEMLRFLYFQIGNLIDHDLKYWILPLSSHPISHMQVHMCVGSSSLDSSFPDLLKDLFIGFSHLWIHSSCQSHHDSVQDGLNGFHIQSCCNSAQSICSCIVPSLLVFDAKGEFCE